MTYRGIPVVSLYGESFDSLTPELSALRALETLVIDLRDVGSRYYTYVWTALLAAKAALEAGCRVLYLDRVNPIRGDRIEGNLIREGFSSFVGLRSIPVRHGLTGELVGRFMEREKGDLRGFEVLKVTGWDRSMWFDETGLPWVLPSPNMPTLDTAVIYPGLCLIEGTNLSEGRGTTRPFELLGAPYIDGARLRDELGETPGVTLRPTMFKPTFQKWGGHVCGGVQLHVTDRDRFESWAFALKLVHVVRRLWPEAFQWREKAYEFVKEIPAYDLLCGTDSFRRLPPGEPMDALIAAERLSPDEWFSQVSLLY